MINKYQEALIKLVSHNYSTRSEKNEYINTLQELVNKETPMKVDKKDNKKIKCDKFLITLVTYYKCPNKRCEFHNNYNILEEEKRCPECNQLLDWGGKKNEKNK